MDAVNPHDSADSLLTGAEALVAELAAAAKEADWPAAGELDRSLAHALRSLNDALAVVDAAERQHAADRLRLVQAGHRAVMNALRQAHESLRAELAGVAQGRRGVKSYLESSAG